MFYEVYDIRVIQNQEKAEEIFFHDSQKKKIHIAVSLRKDPPGACQQSVSVPYSSKHGNGSNQICNILLIIHSNNIHLISPLPLFRYFFWPLWLLSVPPIIVWLDSQSPDSECFITTTGNSELQTIRSYSPSIKNVSYSSTIMVVSTHQPYGCLDHEGTCS